MSGWVAVSAFPRRFEETECHHLEGQVPQTLETRVCGSFETSENNGPSTLRHIPAETSHIALRVNSHGRPPLGAQSSQ